MFALNDVSRRRRAVTSKSTTNQPSPCVADTSLLTVKHTVRHVYKACMAGLSPSKFNTDDDDDV